MKHNIPDMTIHQVSASLDKPPASFTREDLVHFIETEHIRHVNFMYPADDGRLKTLNFVLHDKDHLEDILTCGERVDGSSLFANTLDASSSDVYVIPRYATAFVDPCAALPTLCLLCDFFDEHGLPLESSPTYTLQKAAQVFSERTGGLEFQAMGELEYYVIGDNPGHFPTRDQRGYHESAPFAKFSDFRQKCLQYIAQVGGRIKYGHCEVGNFRLDGKVYEQQEIEFLPVPVVEAADQLMVAKWIVRNLAVQCGLEVTFAPKITVGRAGSGLHIHMRIMKDGQNQMLDTNGSLSDIAKHAIAGLMTLAPSLTAFGNTNPTSYFRLVPHQEAPTSICWGDRNRSALVRVPLGWNGRGILEKVARVNPKNENGNGHRAAVDVGQKQTVEIRSGDGSANVYYYLAGLAVACRVGLEMPDALEIADKTYVRVNIHKAENGDLLKSLDSLPDSCVASAKCLALHSTYYKEYGVFSPGTIEGVVDSLRSFDDKELRKEIEGSDSQVLELVKTFFFCG